MNILYSAFDSVMRRQSVINVSGTPNSSWLDPRLVVEIDDWLSVVFLEQSTVRATFETIFG